MKILHIIMTVDPQYGGPIEAIKLQHSVTRDHVEHEIVSLDEADAPYLKNFDIKAYPLGTRHAGMGIFGKFLNHYRYSPKLIPWLKDNISRFDSVIVHGLWNFSTFGASRTLPGQFTPYFIFSHGMMDPWFKRAYPLKHFVKQFFWFFIEGKLIKSAQAVLFTTEEEKKIARGVFIGHQGYREKVVAFGTAAPPPPSPDQIALFRTAVPDMKTERFLLFLSRIHEKKGCDLLIDAFGQVAGRFPDVDLVIAGPDQMGLRETLQARSRELGIENRIHWPGMLTGPAKWGAFRSAEVFILPSHQENFGIVIAEALACGTPVLTTRKVNIWREVEASGGGFIEDDTLEGTVRLLERWLTLPPEDRARMTELAEACFEKHFRIETSAQQIFDLIETSLEANKK